MFKHLKAPEYDMDEKFIDNSIFLAGSITGACDWQSNVAQHFLQTLNVINPRRDNFNVENLSEEKAQIAWEYFYLTKVKNILFYFSHETFAPITLLEYGTFLERKRTNTDINMIVVVHSEYKRKRDVIIQTSLYLGEEKAKKIIVEDVNKLNFTLHNERWI